MTIYQCDINWLDGSMQLIRVSWYLKCRNKYIVLCQLYMEQVKNEVEISVKPSDFLYEEVMIDSAIIHLTDCNVFLCDGVNVYLQNRLLLLNCLVKNKENVSCNIIEQLFIAVHY